ncbi:hypothetical protein GCM10022219_22220 [Microbacterium oryzae]
MPERTVSASAAAARFRLLGSGWFLTHPLVSRVTAAGKPPSTSTGHREAEDGAQCCGTVDPRMMVRTGRWCGAAELLEVRIDARQLGARRLGDPAASAHVGAVPRAGDRRTLPI